MPATHSLAPSIGATDPALPDGPPSNAPTDRELLNNRGHLRGATWGQLVWGGAFSVDVGGTNTVFHVRVGIIQAVTLRDGSNVWRPYFTDAEKDLTLSHVESAPANLANSTRYYAYVYSDGTTTPAWQLSTSPPTESGAPTLLTGYKRGQLANYRYLGTFVTDSAGAPIACRASRGRYVYRMSASTTQTRVLNTSTVAGSNTDLSLAALVPPHARLVRLYLNIAASGGGPATFSLYAKPDTTSPHHVLQPPDGTLQTAQVDIETDASQVVQYTLTTSNTTSALAYVAGFQE